MLKTTDRAVERTQQVLALLMSAKAASYSGEAVSHLEHALQCAFFAKKSNANDTMVLGALLHDIGHIGMYDSNACHEERGALLLRQFGFGQNVVSLVLGHFEAKRYLVYRNRRYLTRLSWETRRTLDRQGGPMTVFEAEIFERDPLFKDRLVLREWDERAKVPKFAVPGLETYRAAIERHLAQGS